MANEKKTLERKPEKLMTAGMVADRLNVTAESVLAWTRDRGLPCRRITRKVVRFSWPEVADWLDAQADVKASTKVEAYLNKRRGGAYVPAP